MGCSIRLLSQRPPTGDDWELNLDGLWEKEVNFRISKRLDRQAVLDHQAALAAAPPIKFDFIQSSGTDVPDIIKMNVPDLTEMNYPNLADAVLTKKSKKSKTSKHRSPPSSPSSSSSSSSSSSPSHHVAPPRIPIDIGKQHSVVRIKEADSIKLSALLEAPYWEGWRQQMYDDVAAASGVGHDIFSWLHIVQMPATTFEALSDSDGRPTLDVKLGSALRKLLKGDLRQQVQTRAEA